MYFQDIAELVIQFPAHEGSRFLGSSIEEEIKNVNLYFLILNASKLPNIFN